MPTSLGAYLQARCLSQAPRAAPRESICNVEPDARLDVRTSELGAPWLYRTRRTRALLGPRASRGWNEPGRQKNAQRGAMRMAPSSCTLSPSK